MATVTRTWWITDQPLEEVEAVYLAEQLEREWDHRGQPERFDLRMKNRADGIVALDQNAIDYFVGASMRYGFCHAYAVPDGYRLSFPDNVVTLHSKVLSRPARDDEELR